MERADVLPQLFADRAVTHAERTFIQEVDGEELTYAELQRRILQWAGGFRAQGVGEGDVVAVMLPNRPAMLLSWMGLASLRAIELPVNTAFIGKVLEDVLQTAGSRLMVVDEQFVDRLVDVAPKLPNLETVVVVGKAPDLDLGATTVLSLDDFLAAGEAPSEPLPSDPWDTACIVWTSGTTGPSKGTLVSWAQLLAMGTGAFPPDDMGEDDAIYSPFPLYYVGGKLFLYLAAFVNARLVIRERFSTTGFWEEIRRYNCTYSPLNPATTYFLYKQDPKPDDADTPLHSVLLAPIVPEMQDFCQRFGVRYWTTYNSTELSCPIVAAEWNQDNIKSCGRVRPGYQVRVVDEHDVEVSPGEVGELVVRSDEPWLLMKAYFGRPDATVDAWRNLWFHTGDAFTYDEDGNYYFVDRIKDAIRRRGQNISSAEVEAVVNEHPAVEECAVVAAPSEWGEDDVRAVITVRQGHSVEPEEIFEFCKENLPRFMVPRYVDIFDELPKTPTEKIQKSKLRESGVTDRTWDREAAGLTV